MEVSAASPPRAERSPLAQDWHTLAGQAGCIEREQAGCNGPVLAAERIPLARALAVEHKLHVLAAEQRLRVLTAGLVQEVANIV